MRCQTCGQTVPETNEQLIKRARQFRDAYGKTYSYACSGSPVINLQELLTDLTNALEKEMATPIARTKCDC